MFGVESRIRDTGDLWRLFESSGKKELCNMIFNDIIVLHNVNTMSKQSVAP